MPDEKSREVRLGLVMYGGVSLAIYINGISTEFIRAVRGNGVYKLIKALTDSEVVVDVISGTSAGGINGIFLSYALTNGLEFSNTAELWRNLSDIGDLLRPTNTDPADCQSLLDSEGYYQKNLVEAFRKMQSQQYQKGYDDPTMISELDLFVTGTDIDGNIYTTFDDGGRPIDVKDHRSVFHLKHRAGRKEPFNPTRKYSNPQIAFAALAKLARITSCFPAAFAPVYVTKSSTPAEEGFQEEDLHLQSWGGLIEGAYFLDGGVLDNKPFTHTIRTIFYRTADRDTDRILFYVEPDPERFKQRLPKQPSFFRATLEGAHGIKSYESIADDLKLISEHNSRIDLFRRLCWNLRGKIQRSTAPLGVTPPDTMAEPQRTLYLNSRLAQISNRVVHGVLRVNGRDKYMKEEERRKAADLIKGFDDWRGDVVDTLKRFDIYFRLRRLFHVIYRIRESLYDLVTVEWQKLFPDDSSAHVSSSDEMKLIVGGKSYSLDLSQHNNLIGLKDAINALDLRVSAVVITNANQKSYRLRIKSPEKVRLVDSDASPVTLKPVLPAPSATKLLRALNRQVKFLDIVRFWMEDLVDTADIKWKGRPAEKVWDEVICAMERLLNVQGSPTNLTPKSYSYNTPFEDRPTEEELDQVYNDLRQRAEAIKEDFNGAPKPRSIFSGLLELADAYESRVFAYYSAEEVEEFKTEYDEFVNFDASMFPIELLSDLYEKDVIKTVRISPVNADKGFSDRPLNEKLAGKSLAHFGGFVKKSWRANDVLWGRLDGLCQLVECLFTRERLEGILWKDHLRQKIRGSFFEPDGAQHPGMELRRLFRHCGQQTLDEISEWLNRLLSDDDREREAALAQPQLESKRDLLIEMAHLEILHEEVPTVIGAAIEEQAKWNQFRVCDKKRKSLSDWRITRNIKKFKYSDADDLDGSDLELCTALAGWVGKDNARVEKYFKTTPLFDQTRWDEIRAGTTQSYGQTLLIQAIARSQMIYDPEHGVFRPGNGVIDPLVSTVAAEQYAKLGLSRFNEEPADAPAPTQTKLGRFFRDKYAVGSEDAFRNIPGLVLLEIMSTALLVLRNCILGAFPPETRQRVRSHGVYRFGINLPLKATHWIVGMWRRDPISIIVFHAVLVVASVLTLVIAISWWDSILFQKTLCEPQVKYLLLLIGLPLAILLAQPIYGKWLGRWSRTAGRLAIAAVGIGAAALLWKCIVGWRDAVSMVPFIICGMGALLVGWWIGRRR